MARGRRVSFRRKEFAAALRACVRRVSPRDGDAPAPCGPSPAGSDPDPAGHVPAITSTVPKYRPGGFSQFRVHCSRDQTVVAQPMECGYLQDIVALGAHGGHGAHANWRGFSPSARLPL